MCVCFHFLFLFLFCHVHTTPVQTETEPNSHHRQNVAQSSDLSGTRVKHLDACSARESYFQRNILRWRKFIG